MYKWQQVKTLKAQGVSIKGITKQLKLSKNTVRKYLRSSEPPRFKARHYERLLAQYEETVEGMLEKHYIGTRIYNELLPLGYKGSLSSVHRYLAGIKEEDVIRALAGAIEFFGGLTEELVIDNPKQLVITHKKNGTVRYNDEFLRFCGLYGIQPNPCRNYRARTKGKAERPFYYLQEHLLRGLEVKDLSEFDRLLAGFTGKYNARLHSDLKESPDVRFQKEMEKLNRIPLVEPAILYNRQIRTVSNDGYISWDGALYPVAMRQCLQDVRVEAEFGKTIKVYDVGGELIAEHNARLFAKGIRPVHPG